MKMKDKVKEQVIVEAVKLMSKGYCAEDAVFMVLKKRALKVSSKDYDELIDLAIDKQYEM